MYSRNMKGISRRVILERIAGSESMKRNYSHKEAQKHTKADLLCGSCAFLWLCFFFCQRVNRRWRLLAFVFHRPPSDKEVSYGVAAGLRGHSNVINKSFGGKRMQRAIREDVEGNGASETIFAIHKNIEYQMHQSPNPVADEYGPRV